MNIASANATVLEVSDVCKSFVRENGEPVHALDHVSLSARSATLTALVGPDGAGKTTLLRLIAGLLSTDSGTLEVLGIDVAQDPAQVQARIGYMPQRFGLYEDLTVQENLNLYADLHGVSAAERRTRYPQLMEMTSLGEFVDRLAGQLSGGMKQKLGLACTLIRSPELLLLDEPTVGVDPLSRRELWEIILQLVKSEGLSVLVSTSYLDEAERCKFAVVLHHGKMLADGPPGEVSALAAGKTFLITPPEGTPARSVQSRLLDDPAVVDAVPEGGLVRAVFVNPDHRLEGHEVDGLAMKPVQPRFEDGFMILLHKTGAERSRAVSMKLDDPPASHPGDVVVRVRDLVRRFGSFTAVDHVTFDVRWGEIFGLLGPNGAGKTTTFRMLCGLLTASGGSLQVSGVDLRYARASARARIGYVAQKFSLYGQLSVLENLDFFGSAYGLRGRRKRERVTWALDEFELHELEQVPSGQLPEGYKQRLAMAAALLHEPETLFLDEPTSGVDPLARRDFWRRITALAEQGVTVIVTTHFMEEAEYCDHVAIMDAGRILAQGTPAEVRRQGATSVGDEDTMEAAFLAIVEQARHAAKNGREGGAA